MARIRSAAGSSENSIVFFPSGGHSHDGQNSSLIDTAAYSLYDFTPTFSQTSNPERSNRQQNNKISIDNYIASIVNTLVLEPAGVRLSPGTLNGQAIIAGTITANEIAANTITANNISVGTITATQLAANIVLIDNIIQSSNYSAGNSGWRIANTGSAEFNNVTVRGTVSATSGNIAGWTINTSNITGNTTVLYSNGSAAFGNTTIYSNGRITNGNFTVTDTGSMSAVNATFSGTITAATATGDIYIREATGGNYFLTYMLGDYLQIKRTQSDYSSITGTGAFLGYYGASSGDDTPYVIVNQLSNWPAAGGQYAYMRGHDGIIYATNYMQAPTFYGNLSGTATNATDATNAAYVGNDAFNARFHWSGQSGQPTWLWGSNTGQDYYVWDPSNFNVASSGVLKSRSGANSLSMDWVTSTNPNTVEIYVDATRVNRLGQSATIKTFVIDNPIDEDKYLVHACAEGPTADVFYRGKSKLINGVSEIKLPDYFESLTELEGRTIYVTPIATSTVDMNGFPHAEVANLCTTEIKNGKFTVLIAGGFLVDDQEFYWRVDAIRKNAEFDVEPSKDSVIIKGNGPYTYVG